MRPLLDVWIPLLDGVRLSADVFLPETEGPFPVLVVMTPYRKDDNIAQAHRSLFSVLAQAGYASTFVDLRGSGSSEGLLWSPFDAELEGRDGAAVVEWAAAQDWSNGRVGMWGRSYHGFSALATAALDPPHLEAIIPSVPVQDAYLDLFAPDGCAGMLGYLNREALMLALDLAPPTRLDSTGAALERWQSRLDERFVGQEPYVLEALRHPDRDEYWAGRAVAVERIAVPTMLIGGWRDPLCEAVVRTYERLRVPKRLLMGPWLHVTPEVSLHVPTETMSEQIRWWDRWLRDVDNGVGDEPSVSFFVQGSEHWEVASGWPPPGVQRLVLHPGGGRALGPEPSSGEDRYRCDPTVGVRAGLYEPFGMGVGLPLELSADDAKSLTYTTAPLTAGVVIVGQPRAHISLTANGTDAIQLVAKLQEVRPDGRSLLVTRWAVAGRRLGREAMTATRPTPG